MTMPEKMDHDQNSIKNFRIFLGKVALEATFINPFPITK